MRQPKSADRTYVIESLDRNCTVTTSTSEAAGLTPDNGGTGDPNNGGGSGGSGVCSYCGQVHTGLFGWLISFFHGILYFFKNMFNK